MRKILLIFIFLSVFSLNGFSQSNWRLKGGLTLSYFTDADNSSPGLGLMLGLSRKFILKNNFSICGEVNFATRGAILENRSISPYTSETEYAYTWDIHGTIGYIDIPILVQHTSLLKNKTNLTFYIGPSFSIAILDFTKFEKRDFIEIYDWNNPSKIEYDYAFQEESTFGNNFIGFSLDFGIDLSFTNYLIELRYVVDTRNVYYFKDLSEVNHKMNSIYILIGKKL